MLDIFISYSRENQDIAKGLIQDLKSLEHKVWYDEDLSGGKVWWDHILKKILECDLFVYVLSPNSLDSYACKSELSYAIALNKRILPVLVSDDVSINLLPSNLSIIQHVDYRLQDKYAILSLIKALQNLPATIAMPAPLPTPPEVPISYLGNLKDEIESPTTLSFSEQAALIVKLKEHYNNVNERDDVVQLLFRLRKRDDLLAKVAKEIDSLVESNQTTQGQPSKDEDIQEANENVVEGKRKEKTRKEWKGNIVTMESFYVKIQVDLTHDSRIIELIFGEGDRGNRWNPGKEFVKVDGKTVLSVFNKANTDNLDFYIIEGANQLPANIYFAVEPTFFSLKWKVLRLIVDNKVLIDERF